VEWATTSVFGGEADACCELGGPVMTRQELVSGCRGFSACGVDFEIRWPL
jgi:hypothetical protein